MRLMVKQDVCKAYLYKVRFLTYPQKNKLKKAWILEIKFVYLSIRKHLRFDPLPSCITPTNGYREGATD